MAQPPSPPPVPQIPLARARGVAGRVLGSLAGDDAAIRLATAGDLRRMAERVEGVVLLAAAHEPEALLTAFLERPWITGARHPDLAFAMGRVEEVPVVLRVLPEDDAGFAAQQLWMTARQDHFAALMRAADARGLLLDPRGLWRGQERLDLTGEAALYEALDLPFFPPELREGPDLEPPPADLVEMADIRGIGGIHTDAGAGRHTLEQMAERARREGYGWMLLADESVDAAQVQALERRAEEEEAPFRILSAGEVKVVRHPDEDETDRPAGPADWEQLLQRCAEQGLVPEVSGAATACALPAAWHAAARAHGLPVLVSAGAHDLVGLDDAICAVGALRRARWRRADVLSTREAAEVLA